MEELTDEDICIKVQQGDTQIFGTLVDRYEQKLKRYARRFLLDSLDGEDIVQNVFIKAYVNIQSFNTSMKFSSWIYRIAHNEFINAIRKRGTDNLSFFDPDTLFPHPIAKENPVKDLQDKETKELLDSYLNQLDSKYREPLILYYYEDMDYQGISEILHIPVSTVGVRLSRGKQALQAIYLQQPHDESRSTIY